MNKKRRDVDFVNFDYGKTCQRSRSQRENSVWSPNHCSILRIGIAASNNDVRIPFCSPISSLPWGERPSPIRSLELSLPYFRSGTNVLGNYLIVLGRYTDKPNRYRILLNTDNRKSHKGFRLIPTSMTLNGVIALFLHFHRIRLLCCPITSE